MWGKMKRILLLICTTTLIIPNTNGMECFSCIDQNWKSVQRISQGEGIGGEGGGTQAPLPELGKPVENPDSKDLTCKEFSEKKSGYQKKFTVECDADSRACFKESGRVWVISSDERLDEYEILSRGCFLKSEFTKAEIGQCLDMDTKASNGTMHNVCVCDDKFNCNEGNRINSTFTIPFFLIIALFINYFY